METHSFCLGCFLFVCEQPQGARRGKPNASLPVVCTLVICALCLFRHFILSPRLRPPRVPPKRQTKAVRCVGNAQGVCPHTQAQRLFYLAVFLWLFFVGVFRKTYQNKSFGFTSNSLQICKNISSEMLFFPFSIS